MRHTPWSAAEIAMLNRLAEAGMTYRQIGEEFPDRSYGAIREFCQRNDIEVSRVLAPPDRPGPIHPSRLPNYEGMSLTARLMGDPCPARAALAQKTNGETKA